MRQNDSGNSPRRTLQELADLPDAVLINGAEVMEMLSVSRTTLWRGVKAKHFPSPIQLGLRMNRWNLGTVRACAKGEGW